MPGQFEKALQTGEAYEVLMNEVLFVSFVAESPVRGIGTANLNSCTAVMVISQYGAILAHIAPRSDNADKDEFNAGTRHVTQKMDEMGVLYQQNQKFFSSEKPTWIVSAIYLGEIALPDQRDIIESKLRKWGLDPSDANYDVVQPPLPENGKGTVFIDARKGGFPEVYVEDKLIYKGPTKVLNARAGTQQGSVQNRAQSSAQGSSQGSASGGERLSIADFEEVVTQQMVYQGVRGRSYKHQGKTNFARDELWVKVRVGDREGLILQAKNVITYLK